ncbi:SRPBCC domain-containing protein [Variovorax humicola]|uniref:SRPBCC domain-containing protein n=1 Tax=Variovorax humicola TaxID=1769758 RepID=A0ABU8W011_9BURK
MLIEGQFPVAAAPDALMVHLLDASLMASCLPGCEALERLDDDRYRAVVVIAMAGIRAQFELQVEITRRDENNIWSVTRGEEGGRASSLQADSVVTLTPGPEGSVVCYRSEVNLTGRLGRFALGMMKKKAQSMGDEFAANLRKRLESLQPAAAAPAAVTAGSGASVDSVPASPAIEPAVAPMAAPAVAPAQVAAMPSVAAAAQRPWWRRLLDWLLGRSPAAS